MPVFSRPHARAVPALGGECGLLRIRQKIMPCCSFPSVAGRFCPVHEDFAKTIADNQIVNFLNWRYD